MLMGPIEGLAVTFLKNSPGATASIFFVLLYTKRRNHVEKDRLVLARYFVAAK
jgi:hypothetical protein